LDHPKSDRSNAANTRNQRLAVFRCLLLTTMNRHGCPFPGIGARQRSLIISSIISKGSCLFSKSLMERLLSKSYRRSNMFGRKSWKLSNLFGKSKLNRNFCNLSNHKYDSLYHRLSRTLRNTRPLNATIF
jgi:hypothetical protein